MYPKVRVKIQEEYDDQYAFETKSLQSLKALESLSFDDFSSPDDSPTSVVRIPRLDKSNPSTPSVSVNKGNRELKFLPESIQNSKVSPVPRPRAVLSSPDNDGMIGSKNLRREELRSRFTHHKLCQNRHTPKGSDNVKKELNEVANDNRGFQAR